jgi:Protein of unknown function (DUF2937)
VFVRRLALAIAVIIGFMDSQAPEFVQQYRQRIGGALDELKAIVAAFNVEASREGLTPPEAIGRLEQNNDTLARERGQDMAETIGRVGRLEDEVEAMQSAAPLKRLYVVAKNFDPQIARRTLENYVPAAPLSLEALAAAGVAALWGWAAIHLCAWPFRRLRERRLRADGI